MTDSDTFVLTNAQIVLAEDVIIGWIAVEDGKIAETGTGTPPERGLDLAGDFIIPGLIELHTDHLEAHAMPRPKVRWDSHAAVLAYDAQMAASGITTVFDSLRVGALTDADSVSDEVHRLAGAIADLTDRALLRVEHRTHLRCEVATPDVVEQAQAYADKRPVHLMSLMDHTPGQRQFRDLEKMRTYYQRHGLHTDSDFEAFIKQRLALHEQFAVRNRRSLVAIAHAAGATLASHDDATTLQVGEAIDDGVSIAEFPTTAEAAQTSHDAGIHVLMGAPNLVRGGSHSGNVAASDLVEAGILDILSSDYVPGSLLLAAFALPGQCPPVTLPQAIALASLNPAVATGLTDRGAIAAGRRADLVRVSCERHTPAVRRVWNGGHVVF